MIDKKKLSDAQKAALIGGEPEQSAKEQPAPVVTPTTPSIAPPAPESAPAQVMMGERAKEVLNNPAFQRAIAMIEQKYFEAFKMTKPEDTAGRERLYIGLAVMGTLVANLNEILNNGTLSRHAIERARGRSGV